MMTSSERVLRCLEFRSPDRAPRELWDIPWLHQYARHELEAFVRRYPWDFAAVNALAIGDRWRGQPHIQGSYTDSWGCIWSAEEDGVVGEVKGFPLEDWSSLATFQPPWEVIRRGDWDGAQRECERNRKGPNKFVKCKISNGPFQQLQCLRGAETTYLDLGEESPEFFRLLAMVHEFFIEELNHWVKIDCDGIMFPDDWGGQRGMLISPAQWRRIFKPLYREYFEIAHKAGKKVFFHTDGNVIDIYGELIEVGVDAINSQLFCMDIEELARRYRGRVTFWGEIDRQQVLPFGTVDDVYRAVARVRQALDDGRGGVIAQCQWGIRNPQENIAAVFDAWGLPLEELIAKVHGLPVEDRKNRSAFAPAESGVALVEEDLRSYVGAGNATIRGSAFILMSDGSTKIGAGETIDLVPATPYTRERFREIAEYPHTFKQPLDPRLETYVRRVQGDAQGKFEFKCVPPGEYIITCRIRWPIAIRNGRSTGAGQAIAYTNVSAHGVRQIDLAG